MAAPRRTNHIGDVREAALELFAQRGYRATGIREIARALELGPTSVYSHISSKQDLLRDIVVETCRALAAEQQDAISVVDDPVEQLRRAVEAHVRYVTRFQRHALVTTTEFMEVEEPALSEVLEQRHVIQQTIQGLIERGRDIGVFRVEEPKVASFAIIEMCEGVARWFRRSGELSESRIAHLYGEFAVRLAGGQDTTPPVAAGAAATGSASEAQA
jgi:AcrR family transcriptional regulator